MENNKEHLKLEMDSLSQNEEFARVVTAVFMSRLNPTLEEVDDVKTAVSEAVTNAIIHGYRGDRGVVYMEITADMEEKELTVEVKDTGVGIPDVKQAMEPLYTTDPEGERSGMGFSFMEAFMDQVDVKSHPGRGTLVTMKKYIGR
ncbi:MAG: anti-sigma F factor [Clostridium sp.]|nr:anti-sigma F factor [Clostridium sp.]